MRNNSVQVFKGGWDQLQHAEHKSGTPLSIANSRGLEFEPGGTLMYSIDLDISEIIEYTVSSRWDSSTISKNGNTFAIGFLGGDPMDVKWSYDGMHCYFVTANPNTIYQLDATTPRDSSTLSFNGVSFSPTEETADIQSIFILPDEKKFYVLFASIGGATGIIHEYDMPTKGDLANTPNSTKSKDLFPILGTDLRYFSVDPAGSHLYVYERSNTMIHRFVFRVLKDISSTVITTDKLSTADKESLVIGVFIRPTDGKKLYITGIINDNVDEYDMSLVTNNVIITKFGDELVTKAGEVLVVK